jgi:hypothetical protein
MIPVVYVVTIIIIEFANFENGALKYMVVGLFDLSSVSLFKL